MNDWSAHFDSCLASVLCDVADDVKNCEHNFTRNFNFNISLMGFTVGILHGSQIWLNH